MQPSRKTAITVVAALISLGIALSAAAMISRPDRKLIVLAGQSNAVGYRSDAGLLPTATPKVPFWWDEPGQSNSGMKWVNLSPQPGSFEKGHFGPEYGISEAIENASVFKFASGSTSLAKDWKPGASDGLMRQFLDELDAAMKTTSAKPYCFILVQGESDAQPGIVDDYRKNLSTLIGLVRGKLGANTPIILSVDELHPYVQQFPQVVTVQKEIAAADPRIEFSSFSDLPKYDASHLVAASTLVQGKRLAEACEALQ
jgi:hypothetical protein